MTLLSFVPAAFMPRWVKVDFLVGSDYLQAKKNRHPKMTIFPSNKPGGRFITLNGFHQAHGRGDDFALNLINCSSRVSLVPVWGEEFSRVL